MNILGLDLSLTSTGFSDGVNTGVLRTGTKNAERLSLISNMVLDQIRNFDIDIVAMEGYSFASRNSQAHSIGELGGAVRMRLWENDIPYLEIPPTCRAKFATGKGNAAKTEVMSSISAKTRLVFSGSGADDMCDAWVLQEMCKAHIGMSTFSWTQTQLSSLDKIDWSQLDLLFQKSNGSAE